MSTVASAERRRPLSRNRSWRSYPRHALHAILASTMVAMLAAMGAVSTASAPAAAAGAIVTGTGSSYAAVAINQWVGQVSQLYGDSINYSTQSSVIGLDDFAQGQVDFGASEIGYSSGQANYTPPPGEAYQYMPDVAGAICLMYNLNDQTQAPITTLKLDPQTLFLIYTGQIKSWNASQIQADNPGVLLPGQTIVPVYRTDASGDNYIFSDYFYTLYQQQWNTFAEALGFLGGPTAIWPTPQAGGNTVGPYNFGNWIGESGSDNASNYVTGNVGTMTYVETAYALEHHEPCVQIENQSGKFLAPSETADAIALRYDQLAPDLEQNLTAVFGAPDPAAYPISAYSYLITEDQEIPSAVGAVLGRFVKFLACRGQQAAGQLGYAPIPPNLVQDDFDAIRRLSGAADPGALTADNCPNPYLTNPSALPPPVTYTNQPPAPPSNTPTASGGGSKGSSGTSSSSTAVGSSGSGSSAATTANGTSANGTTASTLPGGPTATAEPSTETNSAAPPPVAAIGQPRGLALLGESHLAGLDDPAMKTLGWTLFFLIMVAAAPAVALLRRRRRRGAEVTQ